MRYNFVDQEPRIRWWIPITSIIVIVLALASASSYCRSNYCFWRLLASMSGDSDVELPLLPVTFFVRTLY